MAVITRRGFYTTPGKGVEYCDEHVCVSVCLSVCLHTYRQEPHV